MAIVVDKSSIGTFMTGGSGTTVALTTNQAVAAGGFIVLCVAWWDSAITLSSVADNGAGGTLSWAIDRQGRNAFQNAALVSAQAPSGLASGTVITATFSASTPGRGIGGTSFTGVKTTAALDTTSAPTTASGPTWTSNAISVAEAGELIYAMCHYENNTTNTVTSPSIEALDFADAGNTLAVAGCYRIESGTGSFTVAGTWATGTNTQTVISAAYKAQSGLAPKAGAGIIGP